jgi:hypothetical protein
MTGYSNIHRKAKGLRKATAPMIVTLAILVIFLGALQVQAQTTQPTPTYPPTPLNTPTEQAPSTTVAPTPLPTLQQTPDLSSIPQPLPPEFTATFTDASHPLPSTNTPDPNTGANTSQLYVVNKTITFTIKNQPFTPYTDTNGNPVTLHYNVFVKDHAAQNWSRRYQTEDMPRQQNGENTVLVFKAEGTYYTSAITLHDYSQYYIEWSGIYAEPGSTLDVQVQALIGYVNRVANPNSTGQWNLYPYVFFGKEATSQPQTLYILPELPQVTILSPQAVTYNSSYVDLTIQVDRPTAKIQYSLDSSENVTVLGRKTLTTLAAGLHNLTAYAWDQVGNVGFDQVTFQMSPATASPTSTDATPSPTNPQADSTPSASAGLGMAEIAAVVFAVIAGVSMSLALILRSRIRRNKQLQD